jgi:hypothetical protein
MTFRDYPERLSPLGQRESVGSSGRWQLVLFELFAQLEFPDLAGGRVGCLASGGSASSVVVELDSVQLVCRAGQICPPRCSLQRPARAFVHGAEAALVAR